MVAAALLLWRRRRIHLLPLYIWGRKRREEKRRKAQLSSLTSIYHRMRRIVTRGDYYISATCPQCEGLWRKILGEGKGYLWSKWMKMQQGRRRLKWREEKWD
eukprot:scaffold6178_cov143-Skeletonema_menzelii.AAC.12